MTAAALRAAERLGVSGEDLAAVLDVPESTVSRMRQGGLRLEEGSGAFERGIPFVRLFRPLDAVTGGGGRTAHAWLRNENRALGGRPLDRIRTAAGLAQGLAYLDSALRPALSESAPASQGRQGRRWREGAGCLRMAG